MNTDNPKGLVTIDVPLLHEDGTETTETLAMTFPDPAPALLFSQKAGGLVAGYLQTSHSRACFDVLCASLQTLGGMVRAFFEQAANTNPPGKQAPASIPPAGGPISPQAAPNIPRPVKGPAEPLGAAEARAAQDIPFLVPRNPSLN